MSLRRALSKEVKLQLKTEPLLQSPILLDAEAEELSESNSEDDGVVGVESSAEIHGIWCQGVLLLVTSAKSYT